MRQLIQPDGYFFEGGNKTGGGYKETNWSLPRDYQLVIERQNVYDNNWARNTLMRWMFVPLTQYHGGGPLGDRAVPIPVLPCGELPNSEVVTNVVLNVDYARLENLTFSLLIFLLMCMSVRSRVMGCVSRTLTINHSDFKPRWNRLRIVKRGVGDVEINASYSSVHEVFYSCEIVNNCDLWKNGFPKK